MTSRCSAAATAMYSITRGHLPAHSGSQFPVGPCLGSVGGLWLGAENQNLPAFVVMSDGSTKSDPLRTAPAFCQPFTRVRFSAAAMTRFVLAQPRRHLERYPARTLNLIGKLDKMHEVARPGDSTLEARISSYELAFRMQSAAPEAVDFAKESVATRALYGFDEPLTADFGRKCLLARRLVERGVRSFRFIRALTSATTGMALIPT